MLLAYRQLPDQLPVITLGKETLFPQPQIKWLGVIVDRELTFSAPGRALEKKGTQVGLQLGRLARTVWGIPLSQCLQLITSLIHSRTDYAVSVWNQQGKNTATVKAIQRINIQHSSLHWGAARPTLWYSSRMIPPHHLLSTDLTRRHRKPLRDCSPS